MHILYDTAYVVWYFGRLGELHSRFLFHTIIILKDSDMLKNHKVTVVFIPVNLHVNRLGRRFTKKEGIIEWYYVFW